MNLPTELCPIYAPFFGYAGATFAMTLSGASYGTAKSGLAIAGTGTFKPELVMKAIIPVVMAGIIAIYGLVVSVLISSGIPDTGVYSLYAYLSPLNHSGFCHLGAGLSVGLTGVAAGYAVGIVGDAGVKGYGQQPKLFVGMILVLIFAEVLGLYGMIMGLILHINAGSSQC